MFDSTYYQRPDVLKELQLNANNTLNIAAQSAFTNSSYLAAAHQLAFNCQNNSTTNIMPSFFQNQNMLTSNFFGVQNFGDTSSTNNNLNTTTKPVESNLDTCEPSTASEDCQKHVPVLSPTVSSSIESTNIMPNFSADFSMPESSKGVKIELANRELWLPFYKVTNEMVVNKPGRFVVSYIKFYFYVKVLFF